MAVDFDARILFIGDYDVTDECLYLIRGHLPSIHVHSLSQFAAVSE